LADKDWFRRKTWTADDQAAFFARLKRSRTGFHKAQYCQIQAFELQQVGYYKPALELLDLLMSEWPEDAMLAPVWQQTAECRARLGDLTGAISAYRSVFAEQRRRPGMLTDAHLGFALLVAQTPLPELYDDALKTLKEFESSSAVFPVETFKAAAARAIICGAMGDKATAAGHARTALDAAARQHSGFARHANFGLVSKVDATLRTRLEELSRAV
jgi:tetratricopeptide (TPR) repeat protein